MKCTKFILASILTIIGLASCERGGSGKCGETNISTATRASHNAGETCTKCHTQGEDGRGCFTIAGTAYKKDKTTPINNAVMVLFNRDANDWSKITNEVARLPIDKSGNFYTTDNISYEGMYPAILVKNDTSWDTIAMGGSLSSSASCNSCHSPKNGTTEPIYDFNN
jgi:hypothetical protein